MPETRTKLLTVELDPDTRRQLEELAEEDAQRINLPIRSLAWTVRRLIREAWTPPKKSRKKPG